MLAINKFRVNKLIPEATKIIKEHKFFKDEKKTNYHPDETKPKVYNGYISAFNANCIMMTPLAIAIMYDNSESSSENKSIVNKWIFDLLKKENTNFTRANSLIGYIEDKSVNGKLGTSALINILTAGNALKLAIRKFNLV